MTKQFYYLKTCDTCRRILSELNLDDTVTLREIKSEPITAEELENLRDLSESYEALFNKRSQLYKQRNLKEKSLSEEDFRELILEHYTFLKRPILILGNDIFIGNSKKTVEAAKGALEDA